ncbi:hypothetical protein BpHYR1_012610 [Brachionus plicatilis]|uniref:Uncharacterized protein n=1 Tax=Brachionus plicatilis TaxID=10195 RepID=A0A3M7SUW0_BRAPC|nr:hypothetical protein BpHYR1_012610 [Brachionus plicatilis]
MNTIREASIEDSPINKIELGNNNEKFFDYYARESSSYQLDYSRTNNKSDSELHFLNEDLMPNTIKSKSNLSLHVSNLLDNISQKTLSAKSVSPQANKEYDEFSSIESNIKSMTPVQPRKANTLKQRIRRFNSSLENRIFNLIQTNDSTNFNISHKNSFYKSTNNNKTQIKSQEIIDEANRSQPKL